MSRISRLVVLVASVAAVVSAMAGTASAVTWDVNGTGAFTATAPAGTLSATGTLVCPGATATGAYTAGSFAGAAYTGIAGTVTFQGCNLAGQNTEVTCGYRLTALSQTIVTTVTTGLADVTCGVTISPNTKLCHIEGIVEFTYTDNPFPTVDRLHLATSSPGNLRITGAGCVIGTNDTAHLTATSFAVTSSGGNGPHIVRTA